MDAQNRQAICPLRRSGRRASHADFRRALSLGIIEPEFAKPGTQVTLVWGESPNTKKTTTEPHRQIEIRAIVSAVPYNSAVREGYYPAGWRVTGKL